jgi:AbiV family abortive infection protein
LAKSKLKNNEGEWVETLVISEELWKNLIKESHISAVKSLDASEKLLADVGNDKVSAGLYTYAVEEFGKLLLLYQYSPSNQEVTIEFKKIFREHKDKFRVATEYLKKIAPASLVIGGPLFDPAIFDPAIFDTLETIIKNLETRLAIFYCDVSDSGDSIKENPAVEREDLKKAIGELRKVLNNFQVKIKEFAK